MALDGLSLQFKLGAIYLLVGFVLFIVSFATPHWITVYLVGVKVGNSGLWEVCVNSIGCGVPDKKDWFKAVEAFECLALVGNIAASSLVVIFVLQRRKLYSIGASIASITSGIFTLMGSVIFITQNSEYMSWSLYLNIISAFIILAAGVTFIINNLRIRVEESYEHFK